MQDLVEGQIQCSSLGQTLVEGYFGIRRDRGSLGIAPRLGANSGSIALRDQSRDWFVSYEYSYDSSRNRVHCKVFTSHRGAVDFAVLPPPGLVGAGGVAASVVVDGQEVRAARRAIGADQLVTFSLEIPVEGATIEIRRR